MPVRTVLASLRELRERRTRLRHAPRIDPNNRWMLVPCLPPVRVGRFALHVHSIDGDTASLEVTSIRAHRRVDLAPGDYLSVGDSWWTLQDINERSVCLQRVVVIPTVLR